MRTARGRRLGRWVNRVQQWHGEPVLPQSRRRRQAGPDVQGGPRRRDAASSASGCSGFNLPVIYRGLPLDALSALDDASVQAALHMGLRFRAGAAQAFADTCGGEATDSTTDRFDAQILDCRLSNTMNCTAAQAVFIDELWPQSDPRQQAPPPTC